MTKSVTLSPILVTLSLSKGQHKKTNQDMLETQFLKLCESALVKLSEAIELRDKNAKLDVEYSDGILTIAIEASSQTYIINRHAASQKIWYSSPITGANYFSFDENSGNWLDSKSEELSKKLFSELDLFLN
jgi:iron donor protein CyaY